MAPSDVLIRPDALVRHDERIRTIQLATVKSTRRLWGKFGFGDFDQTWKQVGPQMMLMMTAAQTAAARSSIAYVPEVLTEIGIDPAAQGRINPGALVGIASDGRALDSLLYQPIIATRTALGQGFGLDDALGVGQRLLDEISTTQVRDSERIATSLGSAVRPAVYGSTRMVNPPCCERCAVLAGRVYRWDAGFLRHPHCDCTSVPAERGAEPSEDPRELFDKGQIRGMSKADTRAINDGADMGQVINAHRGMQSAQGFSGSKVKFTTEGTSPRGVAGRAMRERHGAAKAYADEVDRVNRQVRNAKARAKRAGVEPDFSGIDVIRGRKMPVRLMPETIYKLAGDRTDAIRLLRTYGYIR